MHVPSFQNSDMDEDCLYLNIYVPVTVCTATFMCLSRCVQQRLCACHGVYCVSTFVCLSRFLGCLYQHLCARHDTCCVSTFVCPSRYVLCLYQHLCVPVTVYVVPVTVCTVSVSTYVCLSLCVLYLYQHMCGVTVYCICINNVCACHGVCGACDGVYCICINIHVPVIVCIAFSIKMYTCHCVCFLYRHLCAPHCVHWIYINIYGTPLCVLYMCLKNNNCSCYGMYAMCINIYIPLTVYTLFQRLRATYGVYYINVNMICSCYHL